MKALDGMITIEVFGQRITGPADSRDIEMSVKGESFERPKKLFEKPD